MREQDNVDLVLEISGKSRQSTGNKRKQNPEAGLDLVTEN